VCERGRRYDANVVATPWITNKMALAEAPRVSADVKSEIMSLLENFSTETTPPGARKVADFRQHLPIGTDVFITSLPGSDFRETVATARRLRVEGFNPVPHLAARSIPDAAFLAENLRRLTGEAGVSEALVIAGAVAQPVGAFASSMELLETELLDRHGIGRIGIAGHPEGSPDIRDEDVAQALAWKNAFAERTGADLYIVTQFCFEAGPVITWDRKIQAAGNRLPIRIGIPGLASLKTLLNYARLCGIGPSMNFVAKQARNVSKLLTLSAPDRLLTDLATYRTEDAACGIVGCHLYPLGGLEKTTSWVKAVLNGSFTIDPKGRGFGMDV
jgi:methylenetetrahydrofolate reductase (NADPH)